MNRVSAKTLASCILDDAGNVSYDFSKLSSKAKFIGWDCGFEPHFVAVQSYLNCELSKDEAVGIAIDYLLEKDWFSDSSNTEPDYIL